MSDAQDALNLSGLEYFTLQDYGKMFWRRRWFIVIVTFVVAVLTAVVVRFIPDTYEATALILVDRQKVPDSYVNSTVIASASDRLDMLRQEILSTGRLVQVIEDMGLYKELKKKRPQEEIVEMMRKEISVNVAATTQEKRGLEAFTVSFTNQSPVIAAQVTNRLASLLIEDNIKSREDSVVGTTDFFQKELEEAKQNLKASEDKITALKKKNVNVLPESETMHVQALASLQLELQNDQEQINQAEQQKSNLEAGLGDSLAVVNLDTQASPEVSGLEAQKAQLESEVDQLSQRYGPKYPDIVEKTSQIHDLEAQIKQSKAQLARQPKAQQTPTKDSNPVVQSQIAKLDEKIKQHQAHATDIQQQISQHQAELARIPVFQQEISSVMRDYEAAQDHYKHLADRNFAANMAQDLEIRQKGERFEVLNPAQVPYKPSSPDRPMLNLSGLAAGVIVGFIAALALEIFDASVKTEQEVVGQIGAPVFGEVPWLPTAVDKRRRRLSTIFACAGSAMLAAVYSLLLFAAWR
jgi:polysaccharide biosynthesis transport protein